MQQATYAIEAPGAAQGGAPGDSGYGVRSILSSRRNSPHSGRGSGWGGLPFEGTPPPSSSNGSSSCSIRSMGSSGSRLSLKRRREEAGRRKKQFNLGKVQRDASEGELKD